LTTSIIAGIAFLAQPVSAQTAGTSIASQDKPTSDAALQAAEQDKAADSAIIVTGSRIARPELQSPTPLAVLGAQQIEQQGITNVQDLLAKMPQVGIPGVSRTNSNFLTSGNGVASINLRNLGDQRTLVLVNGRRFVAGLAGTSTVDVNNIPADFVERVDVVTGGNSAVYGSDAVAGVVNFVLKDHIDGIITRAQYGISARGDSRNWNASISAGTKFGADDRGGVAANFTYDRDYGLMSRDRAISAEDCSAAGCGPQSYSSYAPQGRFQLFNGDVASTNAGGFANNIFTFDHNNNVVTGFPTGYGFNRELLRRISTPIERYLGTIIAHYDVSDAVKFYAEGTFAHVNSSSEIEPSALDSQLDVGVGYAIDNPFIPDSIRAEIAARNSDGIADNDVTSIQFRRRQNEVFSRSNTNRRDTFRIAAGVKGDISDKWSYDVSGVFGQLRDHTQTQDIDISKYAQALDAVRDPATGQIVCRDVAARAAGCQAINLFGYNTASAAASSYVVAAVPRSEDIKNTEIVITGAVTGSVFTLPYGDVKTSFGAEYRSEKSVDNWDALTNAGLNSGNKTPDSVGKFNVKELFGEVDVPILKDLPFASSLSANGAIRYSHYSTVGDVLSWNVGGEYAPVQDFHVRANYAIATRAPNIGELFSPASETFPAVNDPCDGLTAASTGQYAAACRAIPGVAAAIRNGGTFEYSLADIQTINGFDSGNPRLKQETGKTLTLGGVFAPHQIRGLTFTVDYFNIKVSDAIDIVPRQTSIQQCLLTGNAKYCDNVIRDPNTGFIKTVNATYVNIATLKTSGLDFNFRYGHKLGLLNDDRVDLNVFYTHTLKYETQPDPSAPVVSGVGNLEYGKIFRDKITGSLLYSFGPFSINWTTTYLSPMVDTVPEEFAEIAGDLSPEIAAHNHIDARFYHDIQFRARAGEDDRFEFFLGVNNAFDRKPPKLEDSVFYGNVTGTTTAADVYDPFGRRFYAGVQVRF